MLTKPLIDRQVVEIEDLLRSVNNILRKRGRDFLGSFDITGPQFDALNVLRDFGELTMGELCTKMFLACSTATDLIDRMERNGLIERVRDTADRRVIRLKVLPKGNKVIDQVLEVRRSYLATILSELDAADKERLIQSLDQINFLMLRHI